MKLGCIKYVCKVYIWLVVWQTHIMQDSHRCIVATHREKQYPSHQLWCWCVSPLKMMWGPEVAQNPTEKADLNYVWWICWLSLNSLPRVNAINQDQTGAKENCRWGPCLGQTFFAIWVFTFTITLFSTQELLCCYGSLHSGCILFQKNLVFAWTHFWHFWGSSCFRWQNLLSFIPQSALLSFSKLRGVWK